MADIDPMFMGGGRPRPRRAARVFRERRLLEDMSETEAYQRYRFSKNTLKEICDILRPAIECKTARSQALSVESQVLITLRFLASGSFQQVVGDTIGVDKSTVSRVIERVTSALVAMLPDKVRFPAADEIHHMKTEFQQVAGFPALIGCIDGTHVRIQAPSENEHVYVSRKGFHSINVQAVCDHRGKFTNLVAKWPGSSHDSHIFNTSGLKERLERQPHRLQDGVLLGDSGYACKPYLLTPYLRPANPHQEAYNRAHTRTRSCIERAFGWLKRRFHVLHGEIRMRPERVCMIIGACVVLHNIAIDKRERMEDGNVGDDVDVDPAVVYDGPEEGRRVRDHIANTYF